LTIISAGHLHHGKRALLSRRWRAPQKRDWNQLTLIDKSFAGATKCALRDFWPNSAIDVAPRGVRKAFEVLYNERSQ
jgi:hypothetical protein